MEGYHLPVAHRATVGAWFPAENVEFPDQVFPDFTYQLVTKNADATYGLAHQDNSQLKDAYQVSGELRYFPTDNLKLVGHLAYDWASNEFDRYPWEAVSFGAGAEYQFDDFPVSMFADYTRTEGKMGSDSIGFSNMDSDQFRAGLAIHFNSDSLFSEDRKGPSFKSPVVDPLQNFLATAWQQI